MDLLPLIVNPTPLSASGEPAPAPYIQGSQPQFQPPAPLQTPQNGKIPPTLSSDSPISDGEQGGADALTALVLFSQINAISPIIFTGETSAKGPSVTTSLTTTEGNPATQSPPTDRTSATTPETQPPLAGLILNPVVQPTLLLGLPEEAPGVDPVQIAGLQVQNDGSGGLTLPEGLRPISDVPSPATDVLDSAKNAALKSPVSTNQVVETLITPNRQATQPEVVSTQVEKPHVEILPKPPQIPIATLVDRHENSSSTTSASPSAPLVANPSDPLVPSPVPSRESSPDSLDSVHNVVSDSLNPQTVATTPELPTTGFPDEKALRLPQTIPGEQVASLQNSAAQNSASLEPFPEPTRLLQPDASIETNSAVSNQSPTVLNPIGRDGNAPAPATGKQISENPTTGIPAPGILTPGIPNVGTQTSNPQPTVETPSQPTATLTEAVPALSQSRPQPGIQTANSHRSEDSPRKSPDTAPPLIPVGFAINPRHFALQTDVKVSDVVRPIETSDRTDSINGVNAGDLPNVSLNALANGGPTAETPDVTTPIRLERPPEIVPQITHAIAASAVEHRSLTVELKPEELGHIRIEVNQRDGVMVASIEVERPSTAHLMTDSLSQLRDSLQAAGISLDRIEISTTLPQPSGDSLNSSSQWGRSDSQHSTQHERPDSRQSPERQPRGTELRRDESQRSLPGRTRTRIRDIDVTI